MQPLTFLNFIVPNSWDGTIDPSRISNCTSSLISVWALASPVYRYSDTRKSVVNARTYAVYTARSMAVYSPRWVAAWWPWIISMDTGSRTVSFTVIPVSIRYAIFIAALVYLIYCEVAMKSVATPPFWRNFRMADR